MVWQDVFPNVGPKLDAEHERELRLVEQARAGADWALAALIARYQPPVTRYLTRLTGSSVGARALAEHVFIRMERRLHGSQGGRQLRLWLLRACTEAGLEMLRGPREAANPPLIESRTPMGLLPGGGASAANFLRAGLGKLATMTGSTSRQVRKLIWSDVPHTETLAAHTDRHYKHSPVQQFESGVDELPDEDGSDMLDPREVLRHRMVRAVLAELPYGDAQCLALHLVAGLNQAEVALALGITASATRRRIVHGLTLFAQRYDAAAASLGLHLDFFAPQAEVPMQDSARLGGGERARSMVEALADDLEVDPLTTNEHIAVQPFAQDGGALIWNGRIHREITSETEDVATHAPVEALSMIVDTSLAHVGEPVEVPESVAALPAPPDVPLTISDMWIHAESHELVDTDIALSTSLMLEDIVLPVTTFDGGLQRSIGDNASLAEVMNDTIDTTPHLQIESENVSDVISLTGGRMVPILTASTRVDAGREEAAIPEYDAEILQNSEGTLFSKGALNDERGDESFRIVPVLTMDYSPHDAHIVNGDEPRVVPVLTLSPSNQQMILAHVLALSEDKDVGNYTGSRADAAAHVSEHLHAALVIPGSAQGETNSESL